MTPVTTGAYDDDFGTLAGTDDSPDPVFVPDLAGVNESAVIDDNQDDNQDAS